MSVVHPALLVPEILDNILSSLGKTSQAHAACVCHLWWEAAISLIWHTLDDGTTSSGLLDLYILLQEDLMNSLL